MLEIFVWTFSCTATQPQPEQPRLQSPELAPDFDATPNDITPDTEQNENDQADGTTEVPQPSTNEFLEWTYHNDYKPTSSCHEAVKQAQLEDPGIDYIRRRYKRMRLPATAERAVEDCRKLYPNLSEESERLLRNLHKHQRKLVTRDGILKIRVTRNDEERVLLIIPPKLQQKFISAVHDNCHFGVTKTIEMALLYFYFNSLPEAIQTYVQKCKPCQFGKRLPNNYNPGLGATTSNIKPRLKHWSCDLVQMVPGADGFNYLFTMMCVATRWVEVFAIKQPNSKTIGKILETTIFPRYGYKLTLICDQGKAFISKLIKDLVEKWSSKVYYGLAYHPNSNPIERQHRTLIEQIRTFLVQNAMPKEQWPNLLPKVLLNMRTMPDGNGSGADQRVFGLRLINDPAVTLGIDPNATTTDIPEERRNVTESVYPKTHEDEVEIEDKGNYLLVKTHDSSRCLHKVQRNYLAQHIAPVQEIAQAKRDREAAAQHKRNIVEITMSHSFLSS